MEITKDTSETKPKQNKVIAKRQSFLKKIDAETAKHLAALRERVESYGVRR